MKVSVSLRPLTDFLITLSLAQIAATFANTDTRHLPDREK